METSKKPKLNAITETAQSEKMSLFKAVQSLAAPAEKIQEEASNLLEKYSDLHSEEKDTNEIKEMVAEKIISNYSYMAAFSGGATGLVGAAPAPGIGTIAAMFGGASADLAYCMKLQVDMTMALAHVYGHNILEEEGKRLCFMVAGLGAINKATQEGSKKVGSKAFEKLLQTHLKGATLVATKEIFKKVGVTFTRKGIEKALPFGVGAVIGFTVNKSMTYYVGSKAKGFFRAN